jgi:hypothetical protein
MHEHTKTNRVRAGTGLDPAQLAERAVQLEAAYSVRVAVRERESKR